MADFFGKLGCPIVRAEAPCGALGTAGLLGVVLLYAAFELGRYDAGFVWSTPCAAHWRRARASASWRPIMRGNALSWRRRTWRAASIGKATSRSSAVSATCKARSPGSIRTLSFYRGLVQPESLVHVKVQQMQIVPEAAGPAPLRNIG